MMVSDSLSKASTELSAEVSATFAIAKTTGIVLMGSIANTVLSFLSSVILVRSVTPAEFGSLSLALTIATVAVLLVASGFNESIARHISWFSSKADPKGVGATILFALRWSAAAGTGAAFLVILFSSQMAASLRAADVVVSIRVMAITIPFTVLGIALSGILRGFGDAKGQVLLYNLLLGATKLALLGIVFLLHRSYLQVMWALVLASLISILSLVSYTWQKHIRHRLSSEPRPITGDLLKFTLPLAVQAFAFAVNDWIAILVVGHYRWPDEVAMFNVAKTSAGYVSLLLFASIFVYLPMATKTLGEGNISLFRSTYQTITKWVFWASLPWMLLSFFAARNILTLLYAPVYAVATPMFQVIVMGYAFNALTGPNGHSLIALGYTRQAAILTLIGTATGIVLYCILVPLYGAIGAAIAFVVSMSVTNVLMSSVLFVSARTQPFSSGLVKTILVSTVLCGVLFRALEQYVLRWAWMLLPLAAAFCFMTLLSIILTRSLNPVDAALLRRLEQRFQCEGLLSEKLFGKV